MLETILLVLGMVLSVNQHTVNQEGEYQFYNGVGMGCVGSTVVALRQNDIEITYDDVIIFCGAMVQEAQDRDLYGGSNDQ